MNKKHENKHTFIAFDESSSYIRSIENREHVLDALRYSMFSNDILNSKNSEKLRGDVMGFSFIMLKCNCCGHNNRLNKNGKAGDIAVCVKCSGSSFGVCFSEDPKPFVHGGLIPKTNITEQFMKSIKELTHSLEEIKKDDRLYKFNISALELLDLNELAKDLSRENPVIIVKVRGDLSRTRILIHNSIMIKSSVLKIPVPFTFHRASLDYVLFDMKDLPSDGDLDELTDSEIISEVIYFVKKVKKASIKELTTQINGKPVEIQVIKANV